MGGARKAQEAPRTPTSTIIILISRPPANAADPGARLQCARVQIKLQAVRLRAARLQVEAVRCKAAIPRAGEQKCDTVAF